MFTGIIESVCTIVSFGGSRLVVDLGGLSEDVRIGDSVAVNGLCLTAAKIDGSRVGFDVSTESLKRSVTGKFKAGDRVNIELAMKAGARFGGHIVQGHVDGIAKVKQVRKGGEFWDITFSADEKLLDEMVEKGSVAVNGISLTISAIDDREFSVSVIPVTIRDTILGGVKVGDQVNIETDIIGKMVSKKLSRIMPSGSEMTIDKLKEMGY